MKGDSRGNRDTVSTREAPVPWRPQSRANPEGTAIPTHVAAHRRRGAASMKGDSRGNRDLTRGLRRGSGEVASMKGDSRGNRDDGWSEEHGSDASASMKGDSRGNRDLELHRGADHRGDASMKGDSRGNRDPWGGYRGVLLCRPQ